MLLYINSIKERKLSFHIWYWPHNTMWFPLTLVLLVGVAVATVEHEHAWETGKEYQYRVQSRTLAGLDDLNEQYTGLQIKGLFIIDVKSPEILWAKLSNPQYAHIHKALLDGPETEIPEEKLEYQRLPMSGKPFEIKLKHGVIRDLLVDRDVPTWELNIIKGIVSQLQIDTQGENAIRSKSTQIPQDEQSPAMFRAMEDSVGGKCEVLYEIIPVVNENLIYERPERIPFPELRGEGHHYDIKKVKNYEKCQQRQFYHYGLYDPMKSAQYRKQDELPLQVSMTQMIISGNLKRFTIQSTVTKNQISIKPEKSDSFLGTVYSFMRLTLVKRDTPSSPMYESPEVTNFESTGNLVYTYNNPFAESEERKTYRPSISRNSLQMQSSESSSSSQSSKDKNSHSSESSSSQEDSVSILQSEAALHKAPNIPLLPYFVGYNGKTIQMSDKVDAVKRAQSIISQIADELQNPNQISSQNTLEKYTIVKNLLRTMSHKQYVQLEEQIFGKDEPYFSSQDKHRDDVWSIFRDAVSQSGTGPAFLTIENWIKNERVVGVEAARLLSEIPKNVREPTAEYVRAFFELISHPRVSQQEYVNTSATIAFAKLIRNSYVGMRYYPTHSLGLMNVKNNKEIVELYIPYLANQLKQGFSENNSRKIQIYIIALGMTGHQNILPVFEPYIEGVEPTTKFQRMLMVASMSTLAKYQPKLVGPVFYKIYLNKNEAHEVRCMAIHQFIMTDPPVLMLQRVAKYTHYDTSEHVNNVVKTTMDSIVNMKQPEWRNLANKVRSVRNLLTPKRYNAWKSTGYYKDLENYIINGFSVKTVVSDDSRVPIAVHFGVNTILDFLDLPTFEAGYMVSSIKQLFDTFNKYNTDVGMSEEIRQRSRVEKLAQVLKITPENVEKLEGNIFVDSIYGFQYYPFDSHTVKKVADIMKEFSKKDYNVRSTVFSNYEKTFSFPTENGLPYIYTLEIPTLVKFNAETGAESSGKKTSGILNTVFATKAQLRIGFLSSFEHQSYLTGIDNNQMVQIPTKFEVEVDINQQNIALKIGPNPPQTQVDSQVKVLHYSTVPFTTQQDILELQPLSFDRNTHPVLNSEKHKVTLERDAFSIKLETDNKVTEEKELQLGDYMKLWKSQEFRNGRYKKFEVSLNTEKIGRENYRVNIAYDKLEVSTANEEESSESMEQSVPVVGWEPNSKDRREQFMKGLSKNVRSGKVYVADVSYNVPLSQQEQVITIGMVNSDVYRKSKAYVYWNSQVPKREEPNYEVFYSQQIQFSPYTPLDFEYAFENAPKDKFKAELQYGKRYQSGTRVVAVGTATRSNQLKEIIENLKVVKECRKEFGNGYKALRACQQATEMAQLRDQFDISIKAPETVRKYTNNVVEYFSKYVIPRAYMEVTNPANPETNAVTVKVTLPPFDVIPTKVYVGTPQMDTTFVYPLETIWDTQQQQRQTNTMFENTVEKDSCTLDRNRVVTFDKVVYPVTLGDCKHVMMTTYPQQYFDNYKNNMIPENSRVAVIAQDADDGSKIVTMIFGKHEVQMMKIGSRVEATVNGETVDFSRGYRYHQHGETVFEIVRIPNVSIKVSSDKYGISAVYDGERVQISAFDRYRSAIRGLCGNYDSQPDNDFITPKNCILTKPEEFAATYALTHENCRGPAVENKQRAERAPCKPVQIYQSNVISDREAGRSLTEGENWGYHKDNQNYKKEKGGHHQGIGYDYPDQQKPNVLYRTKVFEEGEEICFTNRPVPTCAEGTKPTGRKQRKYPLYCEPRNEESIAIKRRVENGANPDFTRKPTFKSHVFVIPYNCVAV